MEYGFIGDVLFLLGWSLTTFGLWIRVRKLERLCSKLEEVSELKNSER